MKNHKMLDKNVVLGSILLLLLFTIIISLASALALGNQVARGFLKAAGGIVALLVFRLIFKGEYIGFLKGGDWGTGLRLASLFIIYYIYLVVQLLLVGEFEAPSMLSLSTACAAGVTEEALFRGYLVSFLFRHKNTEKSIPWILIASALIFGLSHSVNILGGAPVDITIAQVIGTIGIGALLAAVYMRSGNIIVVMIAHGLTDLIAFLDRSQVSENGIMNTHVSFINYVDVAVCIGLFVIGIYLIRPEKRAEIVSLWNKKWTR